MRRPERERLLAALDDLRAGRGRVIELVGEPGSGKTRLLNELTEDAARRGIPVLSGQCGGADRELPFHVFTHMVDRDAAAGLVRAHAATAVPAISNGTVAPTGAAGPAGTGSLGPVVPWLDPGPTQTDHGLMVSLLEQAARDALLLVLDDFHWADDASAELLDHLARWPLEAPLLVVVAHRPRQASTLLSGTLAHGVELGTVERIAVGPLSPPESAQLLGLPPDDPRAGQLHREGEGNPLYLLTLAQIGAGHDPRLSSLPDSDVLRQFTTRVRGEIALLSPRESAVMGAASVLGARFDLGVLAAVAELAHDDVCAAVGGLQQRDLVRHIIGTKLFAVRHPLLSLALYPTLDPCWRRSAHRRASAFLARRGAPAAEQAAHLELSMEPLNDDDLRVLVRAAADAVPTAPDAAEHWLRLALGSLPEEPDDGIRRVDIMLQLARTLGGSGRLADSRDLLHEVLRIVPAGAPELRAATVSFCAITEYLLGHYPEARALLAAEIANAGAYGPRQLAAMLVEYGVITVTTGGAPDPAQVEEALRLAALSNHRTAEAGALALRGLCEALDQRFTDSATSIAACAAMLDGRPDADLSDCLLYLITLAWAEMYTARFADAERHFRRALGIAKRFGHFVVIPLLLNALCYVDLHTGPLDAVEYVSWWNSTDGGPDEDGQAIFLALESMRALWTDVGEDARAMRLAEQSFLTIESRQCGKVSSTLALANAAEAGGDITRCVSLLLSAGGGPDLPRLPKILHPMCYELLTNVAAADGDPTAAQWGARTASAAEALRMPHQHAYALVARAHLERHRGDHKVAADVYRHAADLFASAGMIRVRARTLVLAASCLARAGRAPEAVAVFRLAEELARDCGATRVYDDARKTRLRLLVQRPVRPERDAADAALSALTNREREIAKLAGTGKKTREIATELHLSPRTVDVHLTRIYRKLEVSSRAALAKLIAETSVRGADPLVRAGGPAGRAHDGYAVPVGGWSARRA